MKNSLKKSSEFLSMTVFVSVLLHMFIVMGLTFKLPDFKALQNTDNFLDVVLINTPNNEKNDSATIVSNSDNTGGGHSNQDASTPLPYKAVNAADINTIKRVAQAQTTPISQDQVMSATESSAVILNAPIMEKIVENANHDGLDKIDTQAQMQLERERLIAKISQTKQQYHKLPKKEFISPSTKKKDTAQYIDKWRRKVESIGNASYPQQARQSNLAGIVALTVEINRNGSIHSLRLDRPSAHKILNDAALRFVKEAAPFDAFPDEINPETDILVISRIFIFHTENVLSSSGTP